MNHSIHDMVASIHNHKLYRFDRLKKINLMRYPVIRMMLLILVAHMLMVSARAQKKAVIAYYAGNAEILKKYDARDFTHIIYCFGHLEGAKLKINSSVDTLLIQQMVAMKKINPDLKVLLSLGGWGGCESCSEVFASPESRMAFAQSVRSLTRFFKSDGIDLDWEYPAIAGYPGHPFSSSDKGNFTALISTLRQVLGKKSTITFAAGGFGKFLEESVDWKTVMPMVDYVNLMTYDLISGFSTVTGHHTALYGTPDQKESTDNCVRYLISKGVEPRKLIIGAAFYARIWEGVSPVRNGLYQSGKFKQSLGYSDFPKNLTEQQGYAFYWDSTAKAPFAYNAKEKTFATYDDKRSIQEKSTYVATKGLGGIMFWHLGHDTPKNGLVEVMNSVLRPR